MTGEWLERVVATFWAAAGELEPYPRSLEQPILWALPLGIVKLPRLWVRDVEAWLEKHRIAIRLDVVDRPLRACLIVYSGRGFILLNGTDPEDERRFSLAHDTAHFLLDYLEPRQRAVARFGESILDVLDGRRSPSTEQPVNAVLAHTPIGFHAHLMERRADGLLSDACALTAENRADRLALELLAPAAEVEHRLVASGWPPSYELGRVLAERLLVSDFGLPAPVAVTYATFLCRRWYGGPSFREWLGLA